MRRPNLTLTRRTLFRRGAALAVMAAGVALLPGCSNPAAGLPPISDPVFGEYRLGPGDQVRIITAGDDQLTREFEVDASGDVALPMLGNVHATGLTAREFGTAVKNQLIHSNLYKSPSVSVEVTRYRPVFILGEVSRPGQYPYQPGMTVVTAVAVGGGFTYRAIQDVFSIVRSTGGKTAEGRAKRDSLVQPGDVITVYERLL
jgi:polysaccharide export outer membrane protein